MSDAFADGQRFRVLCIVDDCTGEALATVVDRSLSGKRMTRELDDLIRKRGRPALDVVLKFKMLVLQHFHGLRLEATERMVRDSLTWMRFCGLGIADTVPDANTFWDFREALIRANALDALFAELDRAINQAGFIPRSGPIVDASLVAAPRQRNNDGEKAAIKAGQTAAEIWPDQPAKAAQKDSNARWVLKHSKAKTKADGSKLIDSALPVFGYKSHISTDRKHGIIRGQITTDAAKYDGAGLREGLIDPVNTSPINTSNDVWADSAYRSSENEAWRKAQGLNSQVHRKKPRAKTTRKIHRQSHITGQQQEICHPFQGRTCLGAPEGPDEHDDPNHRAEPRQSDDHIDQL